MNKRRRSNPRRVRRTHSGYEQSTGEEIKHYVAGLNELNKPGVSYHKEKAGLPERVLPEIIIRGSEENEKKRYTKVTVLEKMGNSISGYVEKGIAKLIYSFIFLNIIGLFGTALLLSKGVSILQIELAYLFISFIYLLFSGKRAPKW